MDRDSGFTHPRARQAEGVTTATLAARAFEHAPNEVPVADFGLFRDVLNAHYYPAKVEALDGDGFAASPRLAAVDLAHVTIGYVRFGRAASVDPGDLIGYHVNVPLSGRVVSRCGDQEEVASPAIAAVFSPHRHTSLPRWERDAAQLCIKLQRHAVEQELAALTGRPVTRPVQFRLGLRIDAGPGKRWLALLASLLDYLDATPALGLAASRHVEHLERTLISSLLLSQDHSYSETLNDVPARTAAPSSLDHVIAAIKAAPDQLYTLADLSRMAGLSARSLQYAFQEYFGVTPTQFVRHEKLDRAFEDLSYGVGPVADVANHWGFANLGRFCRFYRERFGELPSATLTRAVKSSHRH